MNDFSAALNNFQAVQRRAAEKEKESVARARAGSRLSVRYTLILMFFHISSDPKLSELSTLAASLSDSDTTLYSNSKIPCTQIFDEIDYFHQGVADMPKIYNNFFFF